MSLEGKTAWVTGSARGIGKAIAERLAQAGAQLALSDVLEEQLQETASQLRDLGHKVFAQEADVTDSEQVTLFVKALVKEFDTFDILVNNAGVTRDGLLLRMKEQDWDTVMNINLKGTFLCTKAAARYLMKSAGSIINIASVIGLMGNAGQANYAASKAGVIGLTKSAAKEFASRGVRVNAVAPGYIDTEMTRALPENVREGILSLIPLGRMGSIGEVADLVCFLASDASAYISGQVIAIDGGMTM